MAQAKKKTAPVETIPPYMIRALKEGAFVLLVFIAVYMLVALATYNRLDPGYSIATTSEVVIHNTGGKLGALLSSFMLYYFGYLAYIIPPVFIYAGWLIHNWQSDIKQFALHVLMPRGTGFLVILITGAALADIHFYGDHLPSRAGGSNGQAIGLWLSDSLGYLGATLLLLALFLTAISLLTAISWLTVMDIVGLYTLRLFSVIQARIDTWRDKREGERVKIERHEVVQVTQKKLKAKKPPKIEKKVEPIVISERVEKEKQVRLFDTPEDSGEVPPFSLLDDAPEFEGAYSEEALAKLSQLVEIKFKDFNIDVTVEAVLPGPVVTRFELMQSVGLKTQTYHSAESFCEQYDTNMPGCILLDIRMPGMSGLELQERISQKGYAPPIIVITGHGDVPMAVKSVKSGAFNFIEKPFHDQDLLDNVHRAFKLDAEQRGEKVKIEGIINRVNSLTPREKQVMFAVINGQRNREIAAELSITTPTVEAHRSKVMKKMNAKTLSELMRMVICIDEIMEQQQEGQS